jgi:hypothetical protein
MTLSPASITGVNEDLVKELCQLNRCGLCFVTLALPLTPAKIKVDRSSSRYPHSTDVKSI